MCGEFRALQLLEKTCHLSEVLLGFFFTLLILNSKAKHIAERLFPAFLRSIHDENDLHTLGIQFWKVFTFRRAIPSPGFSLALVAGAELSSVVLNGLLLYLYIHTSEFSRQGILE